MNSFAHTFEDIPIIPNFTTKQDANFNLSFSDKELIDEMKILELCNSSQFYQLLKHDPERYVSLAIHQSNFSKLIRDKFQFSAVQDDSKIHVVFNASCVTSNTGAVLTSEMVKLSELPSELINTLPQSIQGIEVSDRNATYFQHKSKIRILIEHEQKISELMIRIAKLETTIARLT